MTAPKNSFEFGLIWLAVVVESLLLMNYFFWQMGMSFFVRYIPVIIILVVIGFFIQKKAFLDHLPLIIFFILIIFISLGSPTNGWDARSMWLFHAKRIFLENNFYAQMDDYTPDIHNDYPIFIPALSASLAKLIGHWNEVFPKFANVLAVMPPFFAFTFFLKNKMQELLFCIFSLFVASIFLINGYMDAILAIYFVLAFFTAHTLVVKNMEHDSGQRLWLYFLLLLTLTSLTLIKNEGSVLAGLIMLSIFAKGFFQKTKISFAMIGIFLVSIIPIAIWKYVCVKNGIVNDLVRADLVGQLMMRARDIHNYEKIFSSFFMNVEFLVSLALFIFVSRKNQDANFKPFVVFSVALYLGILFMIYMSTPYDLEWHLVNSTNRTIMPVILLLGFYLTYFTNFEAD